MQENPAKKQPKPRLGEPRRGFDIFKEKFFLKGPIALAKEHMFCYDVVTKKEGGIS